MRFSTLLKLLSLLIGCAVAIWLASAAFLFSQEDYSPKPGSLIYYIGISKIVRGAPLVRPASEPLYFGSVGDGNKPPQTEVSYESEAPNALEVWAPTERYLNQHDFRSRGSSAQLSSQREFLVNEHVVQQGEFISASGELIVVLLTQEAEGQRYRMRISHFE